MGRMVKLLVRLKIPDTISLTARTTLWDELGFGEILDDISREDCWIFHTSLGRREDALKFVEEVAKKTKLLVNPNKETFTVEPLEGFSPGIIMIDKDIFKVKAFIYYREDNIGALKLDLISRLTKYGNYIQNLSYGVMWTLIIRAKDINQALAYAKEMCITRNISSGLLCNPHSQDIIFMG